VAAAHRERSEAFSPRVLREYALLADGERGILVGPQGDFVWMCAPRWDSDALFSTLIGGGGLYAITPTDLRFVWGGYYESGSLIWHSRWVTSTGIIECREALAIPADPRTAVILRRVTALDGTARVRVVLDARADFGRCAMTDVRQHQGTWTARSGGLHLRWSRAQGAQAIEDGALMAEIEVDQGTHHDLVLEVGEHAFVSPAVAAPFV
jgi:hypothetical protein